MQETPAMRMIADDGVALDHVPLERLKSEITELAAHLNAAECRWRLLVFGFDRRGAGRVGAPLVCTVAEPEVRDRPQQGPPEGHGGPCSVFPALVAAAFARGHLSYSKVRALTRVATPDNEADLLELALTGTAVRL